MFGRKKRVSNYPSNVNIYPSNPGYPIIQSPNPQVKSNQNPSHQNNYGLPTGLTPREDPVVGKTMRVQDTLNFFTHDGNPAYFDSRLEAELVKNSQGLRNVPWGWIVALIAIVMSGVIAYSILNGQIMSSESFNIIKNLAARATQTATTTTTIKGVSNLPV